jgi:hypothetical protein
MSRPRIDLADLTKDNFAIISPDDAYRYWLHRFWHSGKKTTVFVMLNPSTADGLVNDPTVRRCMGFAHAFGTRGIIVVNLFAARSTKPDKLLEMDDPIGPKNDEYIFHACRLARLVVCGWGSHRLAEPRYRHVLGIVREAGKTPMCFGKTKHGAPQHPLYVPAARPLEVFYG